MTGVSFIINQTVISDRTSIDTLVILKTMLDFTQQRRAADTHAEIPFLLCRICLACAKPATLWFLYDTEPFGKPFVNGLLTK